VKLGVRAPRSVTVARKESIAVAAENRKSLELISAGPDAIREALRLLEIGALREPKLSRPPADM
jgi:hypothetical protein